MVSICLRAYMLQQPLTCPGPAVHYESTAFAGHDNNTAQFCNHYFCWLFAWRVMYCIWLSCATVKCNPLTDKKEGLGKHQKSQSPKPGDYDNLRVTQTWISDLYSSGCQSLELLPPCLLHHIPGSLFTSICVPLLMAKIKGNYSTYMVMCITILMHHYINK